MGQEDITTPASAETDSGVDFRKEFMNAWSRMNQHKGTYKELVLNNGDESDPANGTLARAFELNDGNVPVVMIGRGESPVEGMFTPRSMASIIMPENEALAGLVPLDGTERAADPILSKATLLSSTLHIAADGGLFVNRHWKFANPNDDHEYEIEESKDQSEGVPSEHELSFAITALTAAAEGAIHPGERTEDLLTYDAHDAHEWERRQAA